MHSTPSPNDSTRPDAALVAAVRAAIAEQGPSVLVEPLALADRLATRFPGPAPAVALLLRALDEQVPRQLLALPEGGDATAAIEAITARLGIDGTLSVHDAQWAVETWAEILDVGPTTPTSDAPASASALARAAVVAPLTEAPTTPAAIHATVHVASAGSPDSGRVPSRGASPRALLATAALALLLAGAAGIVVWFNFFHRTLAITSVDATGPLIGDGSEHDVAVRFDAHNVAVRGVEVRLVRGGRGDEQPVWVAMPAASADARVAPAGRVGIASSRPSQLTYRYVLVAADGTRSAPVENTFDFAAGPIRPPVIRSVTVPGAPVAGKPPVLTIAYDDGTSPVALVEMAVVDAHGRASETVASRLTDLPASRPGFVTLPIPAAPAPSRRVADLTLVDADGGRSEPARVVLDVTPDNGPPACTASTCGRVVATRELPPEQGISAFFGRLFESKKHARRAYAISVRLDNGSTRTLQASSRWSPGVRVRVVGRTQLRCLEPGDRCR